MRIAHLIMKIEVPDYLTDKRLAEVVNKMLRSAEDEARDTLRNSGDDDDGIENATLVNACRFHEVSVLP